MTPEKAAAWLDSYGRAWEERDAAAFVALFAPDVRYHWTPFEDARVGRDGLAEAFASAVARQEDVRFGSELLAVVDDTALAHWTCAFRRVGAGHRVRLDGVFRMEFGPGGLCTTFREWWHSDEGQGEGPAVRLLGPRDVAVLDRVAPDVFDHAVDPALAREMLADPRHHLAVALDGGVVVGMASAVHYVHPDKRPELWINEVGVASTHRRAGLGRRLLDALMARARELGCTSAWVLAEGDDEAAQAFYRSVGGEETAARPAMFEWELEA